MAFFKTEEEKIREEEEKIKKIEDRILKDKKFFGHVGHIPQGISSFAGFAVAANNKVKYNLTNFLIYDDKLFIERNHTIVNFSDIKEIFYEGNWGAIIVLYSGAGIPIGAYNNRKMFKRKFKAFVNVLNRKIKEYKSDNSIQTNEVKSDDKMDRLIKLGEMYEKGLLTDEEFAAMKQNLVNSENENTCKNCGAEVSADSQFCSECGTKINYY